MTAPHKFQSLWNRFMAVTVLLLAALVDPAAFAQSSEKFRLTNAFERQPETAVLVERHISKPYKTQADEGDPKPFALPAADAFLPDTGHGNAVRAIRNDCRIALPPSRDGSTRAPPSSDRSAV